MRIVQMIVSELKMAIEGTYTAATFDKNASLRVMARIKKVENEFRESIHALRPKWEIADVVEKIAEMRGCELAGFIKFDTFVGLVRLYVAEWREPLQQAADNALGIIEDAGAGLIDQHACLSRKLATVLSSVLTNIIENRFHEFRADELEKLLDEEIRPMTMNHYYMDTYNKLRLDEFEQVLEGIMKSAGVTHPDQGVLPSYVNSQLKQWFSERMCIGQSNATQVCNVIYLQAEVS
jgi:hypothetical protein